MRAAQGIFLSALTLGALGCSSGEPASSPPGTGGSAGDGGSAGVVNDPSGSWPDLGNRHAPPHAPGDAQNSGSPSRGGTLTFTNIGAAGYWGRRIEAEPGDPRCDVQSETIDFGWGSEFCCRQKHEITSDSLTPFNEQLHLVLDGPLRIKQLAVYQPLPTGDASWAIRSLWDHREPDESFNIHFSGPDNATLLPDALGNSCTFFAMQEKPFPCGPGSEPYCPGSDLD